MSTPRLDDQLCFALYSASRLVTRAYRPLLEPMGLTYPQYLVMLVLWEDGERGHDGTSVRDLGRRLRLDSGTLSPLLKRMAAAGLIRRWRDEADERVVRVAPTAAGDALREPASEVPEALLCGFDGALGELAQLKSELERLLLPATS